jgi:hypothetical protein
MSLAQAEPHLVALVDEFLPVYDVSDEVAVVVGADVGSTWHALLRTDLIEVGRRKPLGLMRTATTDEHARRWFRRYWTFGVGSGAHVLVGGLLDVVREDAERGTA